MTNTKSFRDQVIESIQRLSAEIKRPPTRSEFMDYSGLRERQVRTEFGSWSGALLASGLGVKSGVTERAPRITPEPIKVTSDHGLKIARLETQIKTMKSYISELETEHMSSQKVRDLIGAIDCSKLGESSEWALGARKASSSVTGIPLLFLSDLHFDEVIKPEQVEYVNEFNHEIAVLRMRHTFHRAIELLKHHMSNPKYEGIVLAYGGDGLSGNIHEELRETNAQSISKSMFDLADLIICGIGELADEFGKVFVPWIVGNHGRMDKKPRAKGAVHDNFEWIVGHIVARAFKNDPRVTFLIPDSFDCQFTIYDLTFRLTHGDQFKGGSGIAGVFPPLMIGMSRKQQRQQAVKSPFDVMMVGHWHQYLHTNPLLMNGSMCGYNEYAYKMNFKFERPQQALTVINRNYGATFRMPVLCDGYEKQKARKIIVPFGACDNSRA